MDQTGTIEKATDVLFHLHRQAAGCGISEIGRALDIPKSSVHRLLAALASRGLVEKDEAGRYRPGIALLALGLGVLEREPIVQVARPILERLAVTLGETCFLVAARAGRLRVLEKAEGTGFLRAAPQVGAEVPHQVTAAGKLYLALAPESLSATDNAPQSRAEGIAVERALRQVREQDLAWNRDEWIAGLSVVAAPVRMGERLLGALALALPSAALAERDGGELEQQVKAAAAKTSDRLNGLGLPHSSVDPLPIDPR
ncbi:MAG: IclR family transcriptional regulator [Myxococcota bacterium]|nr:IclR family transcriptional regulator [Myxococcota bacterium]